MSSVIDQILYTSEHESVNLPEEEFFQLSSAGMPDKLVESVDLAGNSFSTGYFVGLAQLKPLDLSLFVGPKREAKHQLNYMAMLSECLNHPGVFGSTEDLFEINFNLPMISIRREDDLITPLLIVQFIKAVERIVRKGLQKGFYPKLENMKGRVKGRIMVGQTLKRNASKSDYMSNWCKYQEFGVDTSLNRMLKATLKFVQQYAQTHLSIGLSLGEKLRYILPAFAPVSEDIKVTDLEHFLPNPFFAEYTEAITLARLLMKRYGYQLSKVDDRLLTKVPPFWIDMSKLFELYTYAKLQDAFAYNELVFQAKGKFGYLDFLLKLENSEVIIDAKYKYLYGDNRYDPEDVRQLSAYARDRGILSQLKIPKSEWHHTLLPCLVIYPEINSSDKIIAKTILEQPIDQFEGFYRLGLGVPFKLAKEP